MNISGEEMKDIQLTNNTPKNLNDLNPTQGSFCVNRKVLQSSPDSSHKYELRLVRADLEDPDFLSTIRESYQVYKKYQMKIHNDSEADCDINSYAGFLCNSPLMYRQDISNICKAEAGKNNFSESPLPFICILNMSCLI